VALDGYKLVHLQATGVSCAKARSIARTVAGQLHRQGGISISGIAGFSMSTQTCTGCGTTTQVSLSYASGGRVTVSLRTSATPGPVPFPGSGQVTI
jgi:nicotinamide mononucleotide (NMN) deamidase PncC